MTKRSALRRVARGAGSAMRFNSLLNLCVPRCGLCAVAHVGGRSPSLKMTPKSVLPETVLVALVVTSHLMKGSMQLIKSGIFLAGAASLLALSACNPSKDAKADSASKSPTVATVSGTAIS